LGPGFSDLPPELGRLTHLQTSIVDGERGGHGGEIRAEPLYGCLPSCAIHG
jgi:hypothetical protein